MIIHIFFSIFLKFYQKTIILKAGKETINFNSPFSLKEDRADLSYKNGYDVLISKVIVDELDIVLLEETETIENYMLLIAQA